MRSHTVNTVTKVKANYEHSFKDNLISLLYGLLTSVTSIEHEPFFKEAAFGLHTVPKFLWSSIYCITQCLLWEIRNCFHQAVLQDFDIGVPLLADHAFKHCPLLECIGLRSEPLKGQSPGITRSNGVRKISRSHTLVELALRAVAKSCLKLQCSLLNKVLVKGFTTGSNTVLS